jgi:hypothetical protein
MEKDDDGNMLEIKGGVFGEGDEAHTISQNQTADEKNASKLDLEHIKSSNFQIFFFYTMYLIFKFYQ